MTDLQARAAAAIDDGRWADALALLADAGDAARTAELLELRARAAYGNGDLEASIAAWEDQHALLVAAGERAGAARAAAMVALFLLIDTGLMSPVRGWLRRAEQLLDDDGTAAHAMIAAVRAYERFMSGDPAGATSSAERAVALGERLGEQAPVVIGGTALARLAILEGDVAGGLTRLEDIGALLMSGQVDPLTTGMMLCELVCAAQGLALHDMAAQWTEAMDHWSHGAAFGGLRGRCRVHRAEILRVSGPCDAAEQEALGACDDLRPWMRREFGWPLAELGTIRLRRGDLDGAEEAFVAAHEHVWCPHPGLALVHLARGDVAAASALIEDAIAHPFLTPSKERPPFGDLTMAPLLAARVEIAAAGGDLDVARTATGELRRVADRYPSPWLAASASLAEARTALLAGDVATATAASSDAIATWADIGAPYETAEARLVLADALTRAGNDAGARLELGAARRAFAAFGAERRAAEAAARLDAARLDAARLDAARLDAARLDAAGLDAGGVGGVAGASTGLARAASATPPAPAGAATPATPTATFRLDGDHRTIVFGGHTTVVRDLKGLRYLARLLADPGREFHVLDLVAVEQGTLPTGPASAVGAAELDGTAGAGLPLLDEQARQAYRRRLDDIDDDIDDARRCNDPARAELAERDREYLIAELSRAVGLGGRLRAVGSDAERARTAVARTLRYAMDRLAEHDPALAAHLEASIRTGTYCAYRPDPAARVAWTL